MLRGESKFEKCTLSVKLTFRGGGSYSIDALSGIHVSLISKSILTLNEILTLNRGQGVEGSDDNFSLTLSVHFSSFDSPLMLITSKVNEIGCKTTDTCTSPRSYYLQCK